MPLMSFSEPFHVPLILSGEKRQTTRQPRKRALKVGQVLNCYFKPRQKKGCGNCINFRYEDRGCVDGVGCSYWRNYFGQAVILFIKPLDIISMDDEEASDWAERDGFESFEKADEWFSAKYSQGGIDGSDWVNWTWDVITFDPRWVA